MKVVVREGYCLWFRGNPYYAEDGVIEVPEEIYATQSWKLEIVEEKVERESEQDWGRVPEIITEAIETGEISNKAILKAPKRKAGRHKLS